MIHGLTIVYGPNARETYIYRDADHQQDCARRLAVAQPTANIYTFASSGIPENVTHDLRH